MPQSLHASRGPVRESGPFGHLPPVEFVGEPPPPCLQHMEELGGSVVSPMRLLCEKETAVWILFADD